MLNKIKNIFKSILYPHTHSSEAYVRFLEKKGCEIGEGTRFVSPKHTLIDIGRANYITIGKNCCFSRGTVLAHDYSWYVLVGGLGELCPDPGNKVVIGNNVFVGFEAVILPGVIVGDNAIIGARSVVTKNIPANTVWAGNPAKFICTIEDLAIKKKARFFDDIYNRANFLKERGELTIENMGFFSFFFLSRTDYNYDKYIKTLEFNGKKNSNEIKELFFSTRPIFTSIGEIFNIVKEMKDES